MTTSASTQTRPGRVAALVVGGLLLLPALGMFLGGGALTLAYAFGRDDSGFFEASLDRIESPTVAVTTSELDFRTDPGTPSWVVDALDADVRIRVTNASSEQSVFVGIAAHSDVDRYLEGVAHDEIRDVERRRPIYRSRSGGDSVAPPTSQDFWVASASGTGSQELVWPATTGRWAAVVMNADGAPGIAADVDVGVKAGFVLPLAIVLLSVGLLATAGSVALIVFGAHGMTGPARVVGFVPAPGNGEPTAPGSGSPVRIEAVLDPELSRWQWLVKWFLAIPHFVVLFFLWVAFVVLTVVAFFAILFTGRYPRSIFDFNVGVMRWWWRVSCYAAVGGLVTDRYPPFSLQPDPTYPASLDVAPPDQLSRGLVLVKWWLLAIPHYLIIGVISGGTFSIAVGDEPVLSAGGSLLGILVFIAALILLFTARYPRSLFDLIIGLNRWTFRVAAYAALMTDEYPPFRLDQGGSEKGL